MKHFNQEREGYAPDGNESHSTASPGPLEAVQDLMLTLHEFWNQSFLPVCGMMAQTVRILWGEWLIPLATKRMTPKESRSRGAGLRNRYPIPCVRPTRELSSESTLTLRKIHGSLAQNWSSAIDRPIRVQKAAHSEWASSERRVSRLAGRPTVKNASLPTRPSSTSLDPSEKAAIRGLDDIFTKPVEGLFLEGFDGLVPASVGARSAEVTAAETPPPSRPLLSVIPAKQTFTLASGEMTPPQPLTQASTPNAFDALGDSRDDVGYLPPASCESFAPQSVEALQSILREETRAMSHKVKLLAESAKNWLQRKPTAALNSDWPEPDWNVALSGEAGLEDAMVQQAGPLPSPISTTPTGVPVYQEPTRTGAGQPRREPLPVTPALDEDLNAVNYMVQNNRILSRSISNLVDQYFDQAAKEEKPDYY